MPNTIKGSRNFSQQLLFVYKQQTALNKYKQLYYTYIVEAICCFNTSNASLFFPSTHLFEKLSHFYFVLGISQLSLDLSVRVVDDGQEHVEQDKEDEEYKEDEVDGAENAMSRLQLVKVEISQDDTEERQPTRVMGNIHNKSNTTLKSKLKAITYISQFKIIINYFIFFYKIADCLFK